MVLWGLVLGAQVGCRPPLAAESREARIWLTTADHLQLLARQPDVRFTAGEPPAGPTAIEVDEHQRFQEMDGFGASWTDAAAWLLATRLTDSKREEVLASLFGREGIKLSLLRQPMGSTDYSRDISSYAEVAGDLNLEHFSIARDQSFIVPALQRSLALNPDLKLFASPWSAPGWMKSTDSMIGGSLKPEHYQAYASYFVKFLRAYDAEGLAVDSVTVQNEPGYAPANFPGMTMSALEQVAFVNDALGPAFEAAGIAARIIVYDHNFDDVAYPAAVLSATARYTAGSAWHPYTTVADHRVMSQIHDQFPDQGVWLTEASGGSWVPPFRDAFRDEMAHTIRAPRNWSKSVIFWNMALDQDNGPSLLGAASTARGVLTIRSDQMNAVTLNPDYFALGHSSKFVERGAFRVASTNFPDKLENVAYRNPDGTLVLVLHNRTAEQREVAVSNGGGYARYVVPSDAAVTLTWPEPTGSR